MVRAVVFAGLAGCASWPAQQAPPCDPQAQTAGSAALTWSATATGAPTNVLLIGLDTLRRDRIGRYNPEAADTPFLDGLLRDGLALDDHRSCSNWTYPSMLCVLTGQDLLDVGFFPSANNADRPDVVPGSIAMLGDWMHTFGYTTGIVSGNLLLGPTYGLDRAYGDRVVLPGESAGVVASQAILTMTRLQEADAPWFLHVHFQDPHLPYDPPDSYLDALDSLPPIDTDVSTREGLDAIHEDLDELSAADRAVLQSHLRVLYDAQISYLDDQLAQMFEYFDAQGWLEDTLVVVVSDHGEQLFDHGDYAHQKGLYHEESDAIAALWAKGIEPTRWTAPTTHADLVPTVLDALALPRPTKVTGRIVGTRVDTCARYADVLDDDGGSQSVDHDNLRLIYHWDGGIELYDRTSDPTESVDLHTPGNQDSAALWSLLGDRVTTLAELHGKKPDPPEL